jgi:hypothetical protein
LAFPRSLLMGQHKGAQKSIPEHSEDLVWLLLTPSYQLMEHKGARSQLMREHKGAQKSIPEHSEDLVWLLLAPSRRDNTTEDNNHCVHYNFYNWFGCPF